MARKSRVGVLLVNLGTPSAPTPSAVYRYLTEFLTDERVIDLPWLKRQFLVRGFVIPFRYRQSTKLYQKLWTQEGSPLLVHGRAVGKSLQEELGEGYEVVLAMRYQSPSIKEGLQKLKEKQVDEIIIFPLFPQYASSTTGSVHQAAMKEIQNWLVFPKVIFLNHYCDHPSLINAFYERSTQYDLSAYDHILFSFHGLPERHIRKADPTGQCLSPACSTRCGQTHSFCYKAQCQATAHALASRLSLRESDYTLCFQSRLGKEPWLQPYIKDVLQACVHKGQKKLLVFCPSFVCDCLETTCEIAHEYQGEFKKMGGTDLQLVEGLNSHPTWITAIRTIILENAKPQSSPNISVATRLPDSTAPSRKP